MFGRTVLSERGQGFIFVGASLYRRRRMYGRKGVLSGGDAYGIDTEERVVGDHAAFSVYLLIKRGCEATASTRRCVFCSRGAQRPSCKTKRFAVAKAESCRRSVFSRRKESICMIYNSKMFRAERRTRGRNHKIDLAAVENKIYMVGRR